MNDIQIVPAILATSEQEYKNQLENIQSSTDLLEGWVHIDFMDNKFVPNKSIDPILLTNNPTKIKKEAHLMVEKPSEMVGPLKDLDFERIIVHVESEEVKKTLKEVADAKLKAGIAIKHDTLIEELFPYLMDVDLVLIMCIQAGFQGQPFLADSIERVREVTKLRDEKGLNFEIAVDGGVKDENVNLLVAAGAERLVMGSFLEEGDIDENIEKIWEALRE